MLRRETPGDFALANDIAGAGRLHAPCAPSIDLSRLAVSALDGGGRGHVGLSLSLIEIIPVLYAED